MQTIVRTSDATYLVLEAVSETRPRLFRQMYNRSETRLT